MKVKSVVDVITNSSSEVFIAKTGNQELIERFAKELGFNLSPFSMSEYEAYLKHRKEKEKIQEEKWNEYTEDKITYDEYINKIITKKIDANHFEEQYCRQNTDDNRLFWQIVISELR